MSCVICQNCDWLIDSDDDPDCFVDGGDLIVCEFCREDMERDGDLDVETNTTTKRKSIHGETFDEFVARMEREAPQEPDHG